MNNSDTRISTDSFTKAFKGLNIAQKEAVESIEGPVMVIAGPGTGKTQILTLRIANILLKTDTAPSSILALTFTESGARAMRERLRQYIGATAYQVPIFTFHGFAQKLISDYPDAYERVIGGRPINDLEKINNLETIINSGSVKLLRPFGNPIYYVPHLLRIIGQLKQEYITPDHLVEIINHQTNALLAVEKIHQKGAHKGKLRGEYSKLEKNIEKNRELLFIFRQYEALLTDQRLYDFEDMIVETVKALSTNESMLRDLQENYQYILADEHQDVNGAQNKILELLASFHSNPNIFVVGDEKQAIYRFQGASLENFLYFTEQYPDTKVISLVENYRSGQTILDAAHSLVVVDEGPLKDLRIPLKAVVVKEDKVYRYDFNHQVVEDSWLTKMVAERIKAGVPKNEIAVIVRTNREVEQMATLLRKQGITVTATADGDILKHPITHTVLNLIKVITVDKNETALFAVLHGAYWGIATTDLMKLLSAQSYDRSLWQLLSDEVELKNLGLKNIIPLVNVVRVIDGARQLETQTAPHRVLEYILQESGLLKHLIKFDPFEGTRVIRRLYDEIESLVLHEGLSTLKEIGFSFTTRINYGLPLNAPYIVTDTEAVQVMTAHKSKGLEFGEVFIPHLTESGWSGANKKKYFDIPVGQSSINAEQDFLEDERRLLYVAMTRAKTRLYLSFSQMNADGRELSAAQLVSDIDPSLIVVGETDKEISNFDPVAALLQRTPDIKIDKVLLQQILADRGFSATSLNNYLRSPWDYFYRNVLRVPETQAPHMQFGTAVHNTLEYATCYYTTHNQLPNLSQIKKKLEIELGRLPLVVEEYTRLLEKGLESLVVYLEHLAKTLPKTTKAEMKFKVLLPTSIPEFPEVILTGKFDRLDLDESGYVTRVVDYKTGKAKSRKVIEGETKEADGAYKRQLTFYALILSLYGDERYLCKEGVLSFVEPDAKGVIKEESFLITNDEIEELRKTIIQSVREIISGSFLTTPCDPEKSAYCDLVDLLSQ
ncbi:MAG TPA: ATP-dependent DNA helicase [Candidatus Paceibacterota bacterium]|nr:ATP-dependent DNA helicase [Candidatus Paceibacterota bacterium]HMO83181.1 ATP-dependent DNA helicase [Candidatus Paceibacterota bacterium]